MFFEAETGVLMKEIHAKGRIYRSPVFVSNKIYIGDEEGNMTCYLIEKGMEKKKLISLNFFKNREFFY